MSIELGIPTALKPHIKRCGLGEAAVVVVTVPAIKGATVTFYRGALTPFSEKTPEDKITDASGIAQTCVGIFRYIEAHIAKSDVDFGSGVGVRHLIGVAPGGSTRSFGVTMTISAKLPPPVAPKPIALPKLPELPCNPPYTLDLLTGRCVLIGKPVCKFPEIYDTLTNRCISPPQCIGAILATVPDFKQALSTPALPSTIPIMVKTTVNNASKNIPLAILVDGKEISSATGNSSLNILSVIKSMGLSALNTGHQIRIESRLEDCDIPPFSFNIPALIPSVLPGECVEGETKTFRCPDGAEIVVARCQRDTATGINVFVPTGNKCPIPQACNVGDTQTMKCPDGSEIAIARCQRDPVSGQNMFVPTGNRCPEPELGKQVKILTYPQTAALEAYGGQEVTITASVTCGLLLSNGEIAIFLVDGSEISRGTTSQGFVSFKWTATTDPSRTHKICVSVPKSDQCPKYGESRDCQTITVSRVVPGIEEQLKKERSAYLSQLESLRQERGRIRELTTLPGVTPPPVTPPALPTVPLTPTVPIPTPPTETPPMPTTGTISIPTVKTPPGIEFPIEIYIDGQLIGPPPVYKEVSYGTHTVRIQLKGFAPISLKVDVPAGGVKTIEESFL